MDGFVNKIVIKVNKNVYLKSPESSVLGEKILMGSINLIDEIGFEEFTFKKLAKSISSISMAQLELGEKLVLKMLVDGKLIL